MDETWKKLLASEWKKKVVKWKFINIYISGFKTKLRPISCNSTYTHFKYTFHFTWDVSSSYYFWHGVGTPKVSRALDAFEKALGGRESNGVLSGILDSARGLRPLLISSACCWVRGCRSSPPLPALGSRAQPMKIIVKKAALNHHFSWSQGNLGEGWYCIYFSSYTGEMLIGRGSVPWDFWLMSKMGPYMGNGQEIRIELSGSEFKSEPVRGP